MLTANRKLIRHSVQSISEPTAQGNGKPSQGATTSQSKKGVPQENTNAENYYYVKQMQSRTPMVVVLSDGETIYGIVEWYDRNCIKVNRDDAPNLLIYKNHIKYLYKQDED